MCCSARYYGITPDQLIQLSNSMTQLKTMIINYIIHLKKIAKKSAGKPKRGELSVNSSSILMVLSPF